MKRTVSKEVIRAFERDIVVVKIGGQRQGFYRSTGRNSGKPKQWLPFDGISFGRFVGTVWFNKSHFCDIFPDSSHSMNRYGSSELLTISQELEKMNIPEGKPVKCIEDVNRFLNTPHSRCFNEIYNELRKDDYYKDKIEHHELKI